MNIFRKFTTTTTTFGELNYGDFFSIDDSQDIIYLKIYDTVYSQDLAIVIDDLNGETDGAYRAVSFLKDTEINQVYFADLYLYDQP